MYIIQCIYYNVYNSLRARNRIGITVLSKTKSKKLELQSRRTHPY